MATRKTLPDDETIIAKYNECNNSYDKWYASFEAVLIWIVLIIHHLIMNCLTNFKISAPDLLKIIDAFIIITNLTFAIMFISTFIALIFSFVKYCRYIFWAYNFKKLEEKRRQ